MYVRQINIMLFVYYYLYCTLLFILFIMLNCSEFTAHNQLPDLHRFAVIDIGIDISVSFDATV